MVDEGAVILVSGAVGAVLALASLGRATVGAVQRARARRRNARALSRAASGLGLADCPAFHDAGGGAVGVALPSHAGGDSGAAWEGGYRGARPREVRPVAAEAKRWTRLSATLAGLPIRLVVRPIAREALDEAPSYGFAYVTGDPQFDDAFVVQTETTPGHAAAILGVEMRRALLGLPRSGDSPRLTVDGTTLRVEWHGEPEPLLVQRVVAALRASRSARSVTD